MIVVQVGRAIVLIFGAVIAARAFVSVLRIPLGFVPDDLLVLNVPPGGNRPADIRAFYGRAVETLTRRSDVATAGAGGSIPTDGFSAAEVVEISAELQRYEHSRAQDEAIARMSYGAALRWADTPAKLQQVARVKGYKAGWVFYRMKELAARKAGRAVA